MLIYDITHALAEKVVDTIYSDWHHDGHIQLEHTDNFWFTLDGRLYRVQVTDVDTERPMTMEEMEQ